MKINLTDAIAKLETKQRQLYETVTAAHAEWERVTAAIKAFRALGGTTGPVRGELRPGWRRLRRERPPTGGNIPREKPGSTQWQEQLARDAQYQGRIPPHPNSLLGKVLARIRLGQGRVVLAGEIAAVTGASTSSVSVSCGTLIRRGFIRRDLDAGDPRGRFLALATPDWSPDVRPAHGPRGEESPPRGTNGGPPEPAEGTAMARILQVIRNHDGPCPSIAFRNIGRNRASSIAMAHHLVTKGLVRHVGQGLFEKVVTP